MMRSRYWIMLVFLVFGCSADKGDELLEQTVQGIDPSIRLEAYQACIILPTDGCPGCIATMKRYLVSKFQRKDSVLLIITRVRNRKELKGEFPPALLGNPNVVIDINGSFNTAQFESDYPTVLFLEGKHILKKISVNTPADSTWRYILNNI